MPQFLMKAFAILILTRFNLVYFSANFSVYFTWFSLTKEWLVLTKSGKCTLRAMKTALLISLANTGLNLTNC